VTAISVVVPVYNVQGWLPRFFACLQRQTFSDFEVLLIDDASTDGSAALIEELAAADPRFKLIKLPENRGCGGACNVGILAAKGETICFADPDDLLPENSLEVRYAAYKKHNAVVRACHHEIVDDGTVRTRESRPSGLPEVFTPAEVASRVGVNAFLCAHWTWLWPASLLQKNKILHGEGMRTGDDIYMLAQLFFRLNRVVWIDDVVYYWIKRADSLSTTVYTTEHYGNYFTSCGIFYKEAAQRNKTALADMFFSDYLIAYPGHLLMQVCEGKSTEQDAQEVIGQMARVAEAHAVFPRCLKILSKNPLRYPGIYRLHHILQNNAPSAIQRIAESQAVLAPLMREAQYHTVRAQGWSDELAIDKLDDERGLLRVRYQFCDVCPEETVLWGDERQQPTYAKNRTVFTGRDYIIFERILWLPLPSEANGQLRLLIAGRETSLHHTGQEIRNAFAPVPLDDTAFPAEVRALRRLAFSPAIQAKFKDAWLFIDKDTEADDNAEHLYRWVQRNHPEINAWFVLSESSHDWPRLQKEGFRLIAHGSLEHGALFLTCAKLISSQMDRYIFEPLEEQYYSDFSKPKFVCLPHGVTKDDVSGWFNSIPFDLFIAATRAEAASITDDGTSYLMSHKEVRLGGFPRYDKWLEPMETENMVFVMPTWRADLVGAWDGKGQRRERNPDFYSSNFVKMWADFFGDPQLKDILQAYGYRIVFFSHPGFEDYVEDLPFPDFVEKRSKRHGSIINVMQRSKVMITDFSSVAYDMAYMGKPVLYYQYERKADFVQSQVWKSGYIDYETMGFGPVCRDKGKLFAELEKTLEGGCAVAPFYTERVKQTFAYHDQGCCQRAFEFIMLDSHSNKEGKHHV
jgi:glycosyltransferase involved in cell wall biosynthesis